MNEYLTYRGKCKEMSESLARDNPSLRVVRGHYWCPIWNRDEQHWWCVDENGVIHDPTAKQFPSNGGGTYTEFDGTIICDECGKEFRETDFGAKFMGSHAVCSGECFGRLVGLR